MRRAAYRLLRRLGCGRVCDLPCMLQVHDTAGQKPVMHRVRCRWCQGTVWTEFY